MLLSYFVCYVKRNPFKKLEIKVKKGGGSKRSTDIDTLRKILKMPDTSLPRDSMARDALLLSFMLLGMPPIDLYKAEDYRDGRISYKRSKTRGRREDEAFISIRVYPEVAPLIERYRDPSGERVFIFHKIYCSPHVFSSNMNRKLKRVQQMCGIEQNLTMYVARHSVGSLLRNNFGMSKSDVAECLNHAWGGTTVTDCYIKRDFTMLDNALRRLLDYLFAVGTE